MRSVAFTVLRHAAERICPDKHALDGAKAPFEERLMKSVFATDRGLLLS